MIQRLSYLDIAPAKRIAAGSKRIRTLQASLQIPGVSNEQRAAIQAEILKVQAWMEGSMDNITPTPTVALPKQRAIQVPKAQRGSVSDAREVKEK